MQRYWKVTNFEDIVFEWLVYACHNCHILLIETTKYAPLIPCSHRGRPTFGAYNTFVLYTVQPTVTRNRSSPWESPEETLMAWTNTELASPPRPWSQNLLPPEGLNILCIMYYTVTRQQSLKPFIDHQNKHFWLEQILMVRVPISPAHRVSTVGFYIFLRLHNCVPVICVLLWEQCSLLRASPDVVSTIFHIWVFEEFSIC